MPSRNVIKQYVEGGIYHIYNRGVDKRDIFCDEQDYGVFLGYLKHYLDPYSEEPNLAGDIQLLGFCLMPNHIHLLVKQRTATGITKLMKSLGTKYSMYFNFRYGRVGSLFQGPYKAVLAQTDEQLMHLSRYIHLNPKGIGRGYKRYPYSSFKYFDSKKPPEWLHTKEITSLFSDRAEYKEFTDGVIRASRQALGKLAIE